MSRYISGVLKCEIHFYDLLVEDDEIGAIFPDGFEGEMWSENLKITEDYEEE